MIYVKCILNSIRFLHVRRQSVTSITEKRSRQSAADHPLGATPGRRRGHTVDPGPPHFPGREARDLGQEQTPPNPPHLPPTNRRQAGSGARRPHPDLPAGRFTTPVRIIDFIKLFIIFPLGVCQRADIPRSRSGLAQAGAPPDTALPRRGVQPRPPARVLPPVGVPAGDQAAAPGPRFQRPPLGPPEANRAAAAPGQAGSCRRPAAPSPPPIVAAARR